MKISPYLQLNQDQEKEREKEKEKEKNLITHLLALAAFNYGMSSSSSRTSSSSSKASLLASTTFLMAVKRSSRKACETDFELKLLIRVWSSKDTTASD